jgi:hypothetical protein
VIRLKKFFLWLSKQDKEWFYLRSLRKEVDSIPEELASYLETQERIESVWAIPLKDGEGVVGGLMFVGDKEGFIKDRQLEIMQILSNETTVAIRNSLLYSHTPMASLFGGIEGKKHLIIKNWFVGTQKRMIASCALFAALLLLMLFPLPRQVIGDCEVIPYKQRPLYLTQGGQVAWISQEARLGNKVDQGTVLARLDSRDIQNGIQKLEKEIKNLDVDLLSLRSQGDVTALYQKSLERERKLLDLSKKKRELDNIEIHATYAGTILTPKLDEKEGQSLSKGEVFLDIAQDSRCYLEVMVDEKEAAVVFLKNRVSFYLNGFPDTTYWGTVEHISPNSIEEGDNTLFAVRVRLENASIDQGLLIGMSGRAAVKLSASPLAVRLWKKAAFSSKKFFLF